MTKPTGDTPDSSPWTQRGFLAAAAVVALIAVLGVVLAVTGASERGAAPALAPSSPVTPTPAGSTPAVSSSDGSSCGLPGGEQTVPGAAPAGTDWELVGTVAAPVSPQEHGPGEVDPDGLRHCFARTPVGALYAAANVFATTTVPELRVPLVERLAATGPGRDAALDLLAQEGQQGTNGSSGSQVAGFTFLSYDRATTTVDLAVRAFGRSGGAGYVSFPLTLRWESGDWRLVVPPDGDPSRLAKAIPALTGYAAWSNT